MCLNMYIVYFVQHFLIRLRARYTISVNNFPLPTFLILALSPRTTGDFRWWGRAIHIMGPPSPQATCAHLTHNITHSIPHPRWRQVAPLPPAPCPENEGIKLPLLPLRILYCSLAYFAGLNCWNPRFGFYKIHLLIKAIT